MLSSPFFPPRRRWHGLGYAPGRRCDYASGTTARASAGRRLRPLLASSMGAMLAKMAVSELVLPRDLRPVHRCCSDSMELSRLVEVRHHVLRYQKSDGHRGSERQFAVGRPNHRMLFVSAHLGVLSTLDTSSPVRTAVRQSRTAAFITNFFV